MYKFWGTLRMPQNNIVDNKTFQRIKINEIDKIWEIMKYFTGIVYYTNIQICEIGL